LACHGEFRRLLAAEISTLPAELLQQLEAILIRQARDHIPEILVFL
jgi:hypothetical protein